MHCMHSVHQQRAPHLSTHRSVTTTTRSTQALSAVWLRGIHSKFHDNITFADRNMTEEDHNKLSDLRGAE